MVDLQLGSRGYYIGLVIAVVLGFITGLTASIAMIIVTIAYCVIFGGLVLDAEHKQSLE